MKRLLCAALLAALSFAPAFAAEDGWVTLFDGSSLDGWKSSTEDYQTFKLVDGMLVANGKRQHMFYVGDVNGGVFKNFELKVDVMTKANSNGGIYFHTAYQADGWPSKGFEVQVNNSHTDWRRSGGLYAVQDVKNPPTKDDEWFTEHIVVRGNHVQVYLDGKKVVDWTQPDDWAPPEGMAGRLIGEGTFALQGHDPGSTVYYKNIRVKVLD